MHPKLSTPARNDTGYEVLRHLSFAARAALWLSKIPSLPHRVARLLVRPAQREQVAIIRASRMFDGDWYRSNYADIPATADPVRHYVLEGVNEGRSPNEWFDTGAFLAAFPEAESSVINPLAIFALKYAKIAGNAPSTRETRSARGYWGSEELQNPAPLAPNSHCGESNDLVFPDPYLLFVPQNEVRAIFESPKKNIRPKTQRSQSVISNSEIFAADIVLLSTAWRIYSNVPLDLDASLGGMLAPFLRDSPDACVVLLGIGDGGRTLGAPSPAQLFSISLAESAMLVRTDVVDEVEEFASEPLETYCELVLRVCSQHKVLSLPLSAGQALQQINISYRGRSAARRRFLNWALAEPMEVAAKPVARGATIIRTVGRRPLGLREAVESVLSTKISDPLVVVHGDFDTLESVRQQLSSIPVTLVHAPDTNRRRGYPINVALDHLSSLPDRYDFVSFLDDDDIVYPMHAPRLAEHMRLSNADVIYGRAVQRDVDGRLRAAEDIMPAPALVVGNFMPINSYAARLDFINKRAIRFREDMHYLEDWDFLLQLLAAGANFACTDEFLAEYRLGSDGNANLRADPDEYYRCTHILAERAKSAIAALGRTRFTRDVAEFRYYDLSSIRMIDILTTARDRFDAA